MQQHFSFIRLRNVTAILTTTYEYPDSGVNKVCLPSAIVNGSNRIEYTYDNNGNIASIKDGTTTSTYVYDERNQLIRENNAALNKTLTYRYDVGGNLVEVKEYAYTTAATITTAATATTTGTFDSTWKDKLTNWGGTAMTYNAVGNMLTKGSTSYTWTQGRKLSGVSNGKSIQYQYDHTGARVKKVVDGTTTAYRMAGSLIVSEKTGSDTIWYHYDSNANVIGAYIGGVRYYYLRNAQNDVIGLIDGSGNLVVQYKYDSWGNIISITGSLASTVGQKNPFRYRGYYYDVETGLYYLQSRYYDPQIRRFISVDDEDVLYIEPSNLIQYNLYGYCLNNPVNRTDEAGNFSLPNIVKAGFGVAVIAGLAAATVLTGGTAAIVCGAALTGAVIGGGVGAGIGAVVDGVNGAFTGFAAGTAVGGVVGAALAGGNIATGGVKIIGKAQKTHTAFHQAASNIEAGKMAMQVGKYSTITFDRALKTAGLIGRKRPDVIGIARFGASRIVEVVSKSQTGMQMIAKCEKILNDNPGIKYKVVEWTGALARLMDKLF